MADEHVEVSVLVRINGKTVVDDIYTTNDRYTAASNFEDWAETIQEYDAQEVPS